MCQCVWLCLVQATTMISSTQSCLENQEDVRPMCPVTSIFHASNQGSFFEERRIDLASENLGRVSKTPNTCLRGISSWFDRSPRPESCSESTMLILSTVWAKDCLLSFECLLPSMALQTLWAEGRDSQTQVLDPVFTVTPETCWNKGSLSLTSCSLQNRYASFVRKV